MKLFRIPNKLFQNLVGFLIERIDSFFVAALMDGTYELDYSIPYYSQFESPELVEDIITGKMPAKNDPRWAESGAETPEEYESFAWQICGMACLKMILAGLFKMEDHPLAILAKEAKRFGVYRSNSNPNAHDNLDGMFHRPMIKYLKKFNFNGNLLRHVGRNSIAYHINNNHFVIASVHHYIRDDNPPPNGKSGHLVLVLGFVIKAGKVAGFIINNPSGFKSNSSQEHFFVPMKNWKKCFSGNVITIRYPHALFEEGKEKAKRID
jgi:hypothetical protein